MVSSLEGKVVVVTGASRGIGRSIALTFAKEGANIALCARTKGPLINVKQEIEAMGRRCMVLEVDMADPIAIENFCSLTKQTFHQVDVLINNAGIYVDRGKFQESDPNEWWKTMEVNLRGPYLMIRHLSDCMPKGAKIINLSSGKGFSAGSNSSSYHVSKAGLNMLTESLANELWEQQIDVNTLVPGPVATTTLSRQDPNSGVTSEDILEKYAKEPPSGLPAWERVKHPDEVANLALQMANYPIGGPTGQVFSLARRPL